MMKILSVKGFTLIEMMISLCLASIVMVTMFTAFRSQERSYQSQEEIVDLQQAIRAGFGLLSDDLRMAGYDPDDENDLGFTTAKEDEIEVTLVSDWDGMDNTDDGVIDEEGERNVIKYSLDPNENNPAQFNDLVRTADGLNAVPADNIRVIENIKVGKLRFLYTLKDGSGPFSEVSNSKLSEIVKVDVFILAETARQMHHGNYLESYDVPDGAGGTTSWAVTGRHIFLQKTIFCRNMIY